MLFEARAQDTLLIENVNVIPMTEERVMPLQRVVIANGKILSIKGVEEPVSIGNAIRIDGTDKFLIPGLAEMHYHARSNMPESDLKLLVANGITTVRNMAELGGQDQVAIREKTQTGALLPINYFTSGPYLTSADIATAELARTTVQMHHEKKYDFLKIAGNLGLEAYMETLHHSRKLGVPVVGHAQRDLPLEFSLRMQSIEHVEEFIYLSESENGTPIYRYSHADLQSVASKIKDSGIYIGTTLSIFNFITACMDDERFTYLQTHDLTKYIAPKEREGFLTENNDYRKLRNLEFEGVKAPEFFETQFQWILQFTGILSAAGVPLLTGSDTYGGVVAGFSLHQEFEFLREAGLTPFEILLAGTVNPARYLDTYSMEGTITEGKNANLVMLNKNPLEDISNTQEIEGVFIKGDYFNRRQLDQMLNDVEEAFK